jgi:adenylate cyclase
MLASGGRRTAGDSMIDTGLGMGATDRRVDWPHLIRRIRLASGLVLFAYVSTHLINHGFGVVSLDALETVRRGFTWAWRLPPLTTALYGAFLVHIGLAMWSVYSRRSLRMQPWEAAQLLLGLSIPPLLLVHVLGTRMAHELYGLQDTYAYVLLVQWVFSPQYALQQVAVLLIAWLHGCIGLHFWLRLRPWYPRAVPYLYGGALLLPVVALIGYAVAGRAVLLMSMDPAWTRRAAAAIRFPPGSAVEAIDRMHDILQFVFAGLLSATLLARVVRDRLARGGRLAVTYPDGRTVALSPGMTVLEGSRSAGVPHASVCGGRGRCSTCRVRIGRGAETLPLAGPEERRVLDRVGAPPGVRLACQLRPTHDLDITPLLPATASPREALNRPAYVAGAEKEIAILFADLRDFTRLSEHKLPFDVVFLLNRYFTEMGRAIEESGGRVDKFIGDGIMALFGIDTTPQAGARAGLAAVKRMGASLEALNAALAHDLREPLRIGIGLHAGHAIVGEMGYARATSVTAIGDAVNTASRLESLSKGYGAQFVVSETVERLAGVDLSAFPRHEIEIRGRSGSLPIRVVERVADLP